MIFVAAFLPYIAANGEYPRKSDLLNQNPSQGRREKKLALTVYSDQPKIIIESRESKRYEEVSNGWPCGAVRRCCQRACAKT